MIALRWWLFVAFTFLMLSYSLSFNLIYSIGDTAPLAYRYQSPADKNWEWVDQWNGLTLWQHWLGGDNPMYLEQTDTIGSTIAPFRYRAATPALVRLIPLPAQIAWQLWNAVMITALGTGMTAYVLRYYHLPRLSALLGGFMAVATVAVTRTALVPSIDITTMVVMVGLMAALHEKRMVLYGLIAALAVLTKEIFLIAAPLWWITNRFGWRWLIGLIPILVFAAVRLFYGASPLEVSYGYNLLDAAQAAAIGVRYARTDTIGIGLFSIALFLSMGYLWLGLPLAFRRSGDTKRTVLVSIVLVIAALFFLSSQVQRNMGIVAIVLIPPLLQYWETNHGE